MRPLQRGALMLVGAVVAGFAGAYFGERHLANRAAQIEASLRADYATREVVVASKNLTKGTQLHERHVALRKMPITYLHERALNPNQWSQLAGNTLTTTIAAGEVILPSQVHRDARARLAELVSSGDRAITIPVSGSAAIAGLLHPGDRLDLLLTYRSSDTEETLPLLDDVPILATGERTLETTMPKATAGYRSITLAVSPAEAARITHAMTVGEIRVVLRGDNDHETMPFAAVNTAAITQPSTPINRTEQVELIIGGSE
ncbi:MAG: Flp pilus assembly protein CpaB [Spiribacter sp.]|nr:Flp pilus assembly protein CpaB [Spiribacter sp.]MDR9489673.1 Flp pilus assembly protein CpaB [Spiribacter sp.]